MKTKHDTELINILQKEISNKLIEIHEDVDRYISEMENTFPFKYSGIDWLPENYQFYSNVANLSSAERKNSIDDFFQNILNKYPDLIDEEVITIGDYLTNICFKMKFKYFITIREYFLELPQDTYIWFSKSKKCINYTFEDEIYFG